jgi:hypothetical protein
VNKRATTRIESEICYTNNIVWAKHNITLAKLGISKCEETQEFSLNQQPNFLKVHAGFSS